MFLVVVFVGKEGKENRFPRCSWSRNTIFCVGVTPSTVCILHSPKDTYVVLTDHLCWKDKSPSWCTSSQELPERAAAAEAACWAPVLHQCMQTWNCCALKSKVWIMPKVRPQQENVSACDGIQRDLVLFLLWKFLLGNSSGYTGMSVTLTLLPARGSLLLIVTGMSHAVASIFSIFFTREITSGGLLALHKPGRGSESGGYFKWDKWWCCSSSAFFRVVRD